MGIEQEYWQSLSYLPSTAEAGSDKIKARIYDGKTQAMSKLGGSCYADLTEPQGVTPVYWQITNKKPFFQGGRVGNFKAKLLQNVYSHVSCQGMPCDSILKFRKVLRKHGR